jgi:RNA polymerase sigma-70 factor (ECF subfamily)
MSHGRESRTGSTLLDVLQNPNDNCAWSRFVERYGPKISGWCRRKGLKREHVEDVTQNVLLKLVVKLREFKYDPHKGKFRGWLKVVTDHAVEDYRTVLIQSGCVRGPAEIDSIANGVGQVIKDTFHLELLDAAIERVQLLVSRRDWHIFRELTIEGRLAAAVAEEQQPKMSVAAAREVKSRVKKS